MKKVLSVSGLILLVTVFIVNNGFQKQALLQNGSLAGAWLMQTDGEEHLLLFMDGYAAYTTYNKENKRFIQTQGGPYTYTNGQLGVKLEFNTENKEQVGQTFQIPAALSGDGLTIENNGRKGTWKKVDDGKAQLAGVWHITQRMQEGKLTPIHQTGPRKTIKLLTGTRFQWAAINPETKEFSGTGGGTYTFANGKYTEHIEFFSRDSSRVGASLTFTDKLENGHWHHTGLSSRGDSIYEVWSKVK